MAIGWSSGRGWRDGDWSGGTDGALLWALEADGSGRGGAAAGGRDAAAAVYRGQARGGRSTDRADYQTVYARHDGSVAAPTAGLHFTPELLAALDAAGVGRATVTLHVGPGTFLPVKAETVAEHRMHAEWGEVSAAAADAINGASGRVIAVGTTSLRLIESAAERTGRVRPFAGETDIFITPGYRFRVVAGV